jgi:hypothetical protein
MTTLKHNLPHFFLDKLELEVAQRIEKEHLWEDMKQVRIDISTTY